MRHTKMHSGRVRLVLSHLLVVTPAVWGQRGPVSEFRPAGAEPGDQFGCAVAFEGALALVGAFDHGGGHGAAYLFDLSDPAFPVELATLLPTAGQEGAFGWSVDLHGSLALVGATADNRRGRDAGAAYLFDVSGPAAPLLLAELLPPPGAYRFGFGRSVAIGDGVAVIGAPQSHRGGGTSGGTGRLFVYDLTDPVSPVLVATSIPERVVPGDAFGSTVALSGDLGIIGAPGHDSEGHADAGASWLFSFETPSMPEELAMMIDPFGASNYRFGDAVAINGAQVVIGAPHAYRFSSGRAWLFDVSHPTTPGPRGELDVGFSPYGHDYGAAVAVRGDVAAVSLPEYSRGMVVLFDVSGSAPFHHRIYLNADDRWQWDELGRTLALSEEIVLVGAPTKDFRATGSVFVFSANMCRVDFDGDSALTAFDFLAFLNVFEDGGIQADFDGDGSLTVADFLAFQNEFVTGCPQ